jgi:hypothetical protein
MGGAITTSCLTVLWELPFRKLVHDHFVVATGCYGLSWIEIYASCD